VLTLIDNTLQRHHFARQELLARLFMAWHVLRGRPLAYKLTVHGRIEQTEGLVSSHVRVARRA
jgi:hypothetical protein